MCGLGDNSCVITAGPLLHYMLGFAPGRLDFFLRWWLVESDLVPHLVNVFGLAFTV